MWQWECYKYCLQPLWALKNQTHKHLTPLFERPHHKRGYCYLTCWNQWPISRYFHQAPWWVEIPWTLKWTKHHWFMEYGLVYCTSDFNLVITCWACFYVKKFIYAQIYLCFMILFILSHRYVLIFKTCPIMTYICTTIGLYAKSFNNHLSRGFQVSSDPIWPDMSNPFAGHIQPNLSRNR
jgi:hypothetical protein